MDVNKSALAPENQPESESTNSDKTNVPNTVFNQESLFGKWILVIFIFLLILIITNVSTGYFLRSNNTSDSSSCSVSWVDFPKQISPNTSYTVYIKKINTTHKWRDVSVFKDVDIYPNAQRESGLTGDDWQNPTNTYTFTFNSGDMGEHKLYFYNNDFESYGESSGTGPKTLCEPVFRYITEEKIISTLDATPELTPFPTLSASEAATWKIYQTDNFSFKYPETWTIKEEADIDGLYLKIGNPDIDFEIRNGAWTDSSPYMCFERDDESILKIDEKDIKYWIDKPIASGEECTTDTQELNNKLLTVELGNFNEYKTRYLIQAYYYNSEKNLNTVKNVLTTFKFTEELTPDSPSD